MSKVLKKAKLENWWLKSTKVFVKNINWKKFYKNLLPIFCARKLSRENVFYEDFLPKDIFNLIVNALFSEFRLENINHIKQPAFAMDFLKEWSGNLEAFYFYRRKERPDTLIYLHEILKSFEKQMNVLFLTKYTNRKESPYYKTEPNRVEMIGMALKMLSMNQRRLYYWKDLIDEEGLIFGNDYLRHKIYTSNSIVGKGDLEFDLLIIDDFDLFFKDEVLQCLREITKLCIPVLAIGSQK